jgi:outer membrane protein TolC
LPVVLAAAIALVVPGCVVPEYKPPPIEKPGGPLSLEEAVELAFHNNPDLESATKSVEVARLAIDEALSQYWPALQFVESFTQVDKPSYAFGYILDQQRFDPGLDFNDPGVTNNWRTGFGGSLTLYDGGRRRARVIAAEAEANSAMAQAELVRRDIALEVARAFFLIHKARETAATQEQSVETLSAHLRITEARQAEGAARRSDVLAVSVRRAETREAAIVARNSAERALAGLRVLLGLEATDPLELKVPENLEPFPREGQAALIERARQRRFEMVKALEESRAAEARVREALAGYHPEVSLAGGFGFDDEGAADFKYGNWFWGASFIYDLFGILKTPHRVRQAVAARDAAKAAERKTLLVVELDVRNALLDGEEAEARHDVASQTVQLAEESLRLVEAEYREGAATITKLLDAELALTQARTRLSATTYDRALARIALAHSVGEYPSPPLLSMPGEGEDGGGSEETADDDRQES